MSELAWFVAGVVVAGIAAYCLGRRRGSIVRDKTPAPAVPPASQVLAPGPGAAEARRVALTLAEELATLVSGVEGRTHEVIQAATDLVRLPPAAEALVRDVQRLRTLHTKLVAFGRARTANGGATAVSDLVASIRDELQHMQLGLELRWDPPTGLPDINGSPDVVRDALLFLCAALLRAERGATLLTVQAEPCFANTTPRVQLELALEWVTETKPRTTDLFADPSFMLDLEAANHLITSLGGEVTVTRMPGHGARAVVHWLAAPRSQPAQELGQGVLTHRYGGALLLEADPSIRAMLANELKATGRAVFACADGASARSFLEATPERFELLVVDHHHRLDGDHALLQTIRRVAPELKVCVLAQDTGQAGTSLPRVHCIRKPFGVHELRRALATVLAG
ncbi:MAG: hypothetical protein JNK78_15945 [Planctomycetes bacterium]|nr:hypothetical protein [Planctomycetota bacterium]